MDIYLLIEGQQQGPYSEDQIHQSIAEGLIPADLPAWQDGLPSWVPISNIMGSKPLPPPVPPPFVPASLPPLISTQSNAQGASSRVQPPTYPWYRSSVIVALAIFIPWIMGPYLAALLKPIMIAALIVVATGSIYYRKNGVLKTWPRPKLQRWLAVLLLVFVVPYYLFLVFQSLGFSSTLSGVYRTPDGKGSLTIISDSEVDITTTDGTFPGHYEQEGDKYRVIVTILGTQQVFYFKLVKDGAEDQSGTLFLSPSYYSVAQLYYSGKDKANNGNLDGAISDFNQVIETFPHYADVYFQRGDAENKKGEDNAAIVDYKKAIELDPKSEASTELDLLMSEKQQKEQDARARLIQNVGLPTVRISSAESSLNSSLPYLDQVSALKQSVANSPNDYKPDFMLGMVYYRAGHYGEAIDAFGAAKTLSPNDPKILNACGCASLEAGYSESAEVDFHKTIALDPKYSDAHFNLAIACATENPPSLELAHQEYQQALDLGGQKDDQLEKLLK